MPARRQYQKTIEVERGRNGTTIGSRWGRRCVVPNAAIGQGTLDHMMVSRGVVTWERFLIEFFFFRFSSSNKHAGVAHYRIAKFPRLSLSETC